MVMKLNTQLFYPGKGYEIGYAKITWKSGPLGKTVICIKPDM